MSIVKIAFMIIGLVIMLSIPGCDFAREQIANVKMPRGTELSFETILYESHNLLNTGYDKIPPGQIEVVADNQAELTGMNHWITEEVGSKILAVDFSRYFVVVAMMGDMGQPGYGIQVTKIWQNKSTVYVKADFVFLKPGTLANQVMTSPKHIVKVSKENMPQFGEITFKMIDKFGRDWASSSDEIPPYLK